MTLLAPEGLNATKRGTDLGSSCCGAPWTPLYPFQGPCQQFFVRRNNGRRASRLAAALSALGQGPQGQADSFRNPGFLGHRLQGGEAFLFVVPEGQKGMEDVAARDRKSTRLNSSHH